MPLQWASGAGVAPAERLLAKMLSTTMSMNTTASPTATTTIAGVDMGRDQPPEPGTNVFALSCRFNGAVLLRLAHITERFFRLVLGLSS